MVGGKEGEGANLTAGDVEPRRRRRVNGQDAKLEGR